MFVGIVSQWGDGRALRSGFLVGVSFCTGESSIVFEVIARGGLFELLG
jgi:hypothetical protein